MLDGVRIIVPISENNEITIRIMNKGGIRNKPYFKVFDSKGKYYDSVGIELNKQSLNTLEPKLFEKLSHINVTKNSKKNIMDILNKVIEKERK